MAFVAASEECLRLSSSKAVTLLVGSDDTTFTFDHVAGPQTTQEQFFRGTNSLSGRCPSLLLKSTIVTRNCKCVVCGVCVSPAMLNCCVSHPDLPDSEPASFNC